MADHDQMPAGEQLPQPGHQPAAAAADIDRHGLAWHGRHRATVVLLDGRADGQTQLVSAGEPEPPAQIRYNLDDALALLASLEDARDALVDSGHLAVVVSIENEIRDLSRKPGFDDPAGGTDGR